MSPSSLLVSSSSSSSANRKGNNSIKRNNQIAELSCTKYGGPTNASEMVYWEDIDIDAKFISPFNKKLFSQDEDNGSTQLQYLTFEPDRAGFNNIRMGVETVVALAHAMGKTLVIPPDRIIWSMENAENNQKNAFSFEEILHFDSIKIEHPGLNIISMEEFLTEVAIKGEAFRRKVQITQTTTTNNSIATVEKFKLETLFPPNNQTKWDGQDLEPLWEYLRTIGLVREWDPEECVALFPSSRDESDMEELMQTFHNIINEKDGRPRPRVSNYDGKPVPVDSPPEERLRELLGGRTKACPYDREMQEAKLLHFKEDWERNVRFLTHFYAFLFFQDWKQDLWTKRFIRDHVHFNDEIVCAAARVVEALRKRARRRNPETNPNGDFDTLHVRRNDWATQYPTYVVSSDELYTATEAKFTPGRTVYIATDEHDKEYFRPMVNAYDVVYLDDFKDELGNLNTNFYVFVDQLVAARGKVFFGVYLSTFTGYINRLRGYYSVKEQRDGYLDGILDSYHYAGQKEKFYYRSYRAFSVPAFRREYPVAWRDIDHGIEALYNSYTATTSTTAATISDNKLRGIQ